SRIPRLCVLPSFPTRRSSDLLRVLHHAVVPRARTVTPVEVVAGGLADVVDRPGQADAEVGIDLLVIPEFGEECGTPLVGRGYAPLVLAIRHSAHREPRTGPEVDLRPDLRVEGVEQVVLDEGVVDRVAVV